MKRTIGKKLATLGVGALIIFVGAGAWGSVPDAEGVFHTCFSKANGTWRPIDFPTEKCRKGETQLDINQKGVKGDPGVAGPQGPVGPAGPAGAGLESLDALNGKPCTVGDKSGTILLTWEPSSGSGRHFDAVFVCQMPESDDPAPPPPPSSGEVCDDGHPETVNDHTEHGACVGTPNPGYNDQDDDGDGLANGDESTYGTDRADPDTDDDGLSDSVESTTSVGVVSPLDADTDDDGIGDGDEINAANRNPTFPDDPDSDLDGLTDGIEYGNVRAVDGGVNPNGFSFRGTDTSGWSADADPSTTTDPRSPDTDGDRIDDGSEDANHNGRVDSGETDPNVADAAG